MTESTHDSGQENQQMARKSTPGTPARDVTAKPVEKRRSRQSDALRANLRRRKQATAASANPASES